MPNLAARASVSERFARKLARGFNRLAAPCQFIAISGAAPFTRGVNTHQTRLDDSVEYVSEPVIVAEFLKADGAVNCDDVFELSGQQYRLTQLHESDEITVSFVYVQLQAQAY